MRNSPVIRFGDEFWIISAGVTLLRPAAPAKRWAKKLSTIIPFQSLRAGGVNPLVRTPAWGIHPPLAELLNLAAYANRHRLELRSFLYRGRSHPRAPARSGPSGAHAPG